MFKLIKIILKKVFEYKYLNISQRWISVNNLKDWFKKKYLVKTSYYCSIILKLIFFFDISVNERGKLIFLHVF